MSHLLTSAPWLLIFQHKIFLAGGQKYSDYGRSDAVLGAQTIIFSELELIVGDGQTDAG